MIRKRIAVRDDRRILRMVRRYLLPYKRVFFPEAAASKKELAQRLRRGVTYVCCDGRGRAIGFCHAMIVRGRLWIDLLAVERTERGKGWGRALISRAEAYGIRKGCREAGLYVDETNAGARRFYARQGYAVAEYLRELHVYKLEKTLERADISKTRKKH
jgi:ribosomal protein S18 acetylase RimI-like enzyme